MHKSGPSHAWSGAPCLGQVGLKMNRAVSRRIIPSASFLPPQPQNGERRHPIALATFDHNESACPQSLSATSDVPDLRYCASIFGTASLLLTCDPFHVLPASVPFVARDKFQQRLGTGSAQAADGRGHRWFNTQLRNGTRCEIAVFVLDTPSGKIQYKEPS